MDNSEESMLLMENYQAEDLSAKMARKSKPIPPPLNLSAMGESDASNSPHKDFPMFATSPRSPLVQKNLPFRKRAHSYSSTQTSSECDSPDSPVVPASPVANTPSLFPFVKSPLSSPNHLLGKRFLQEPIKSLLPSPNTSASFFNNECDPVKSPSLAFYRPAPDLLPLSMLEKSSLKSPLQTPTRSVFLQNHVDNTLFFTDMDKFPMKSPLSTPTLLRSVTQANNDVFVMPEPISVKAEPIEPEKENVGETKPELCNSALAPMPASELGQPGVPLSAEVKREPSSPEPDRSQEYLMNHYLDQKVLESYSLNSKLNRNYYISQNYGLYLSDPSMQSQHVYPDQPPPRGKPANYQKPQTYRKSTSSKRSSDKSEDEAPKKSKKELDEERPRRPMNAFMLFAKHQRPLLIQQHPGKDNRAISVVLGTAWRELDAGERAEYVRRAAAMAVEHKLRHPDCWKRRRVRVNNNTAAPPAATANLATTS